MLRQGAVAAVGVQEPWKPQIHRDPAPTLSLETARSPPPPPTQSLALELTVRHIKNPGGDDAADEADDEGF